METIFVLCFVSLLLVDEATSFSGRKYKQPLDDRFRESLEHFRIRQDMYSQLAASNITRNGRVLYPIGYGADPSGAEDSSNAIAKALEDAFALQNGAELLPGIRDLGGAVIDLQGGTFKISHPIRFPSALGNLLFKEGTLRASNTFPGDRHLIELWSPNSANLSQTSLEDDELINDQKFQNGEQIFYEDITFRDILFDSSLRGGGIFVIDSARIRITNCFFLRFTTQGIIVKNGHETFISNCFLGQHPTIGGDTAEKDFSGTAIDLKSNDNAVTDVAIFSAAMGVVLRGQANIVTGVHCYNKATGFGGVGILLVKLGGPSQTRIDNCYMDFTAIVMEDPVQVHVTNVFFLGNANVVVRSVNGRISGLNIVNNMFSGNPSNMVPIVKLEGVFTSVDQVVIERNNAIGMGLKSTVGQLTVAGNGTKWVADFSSVLVFPDRISHFQYSFYVGGQGLGFGSHAQAHAVTDISNNVVTVESLQLVNGKVSVAVDQH